MIFVEIALIVVASLFGLFLIALAVMAIRGGKLPRAHVACRRVALKQAPEAVFDVIADYKTIDWRPDVDEIKPRDERDGMPVWTEIRKNGRITMMMEECERPTRIVARILDNPQFGGTWTYEITPAARDVDGKSDGDGDGEDNGAGAGCTLTITEHGEIYNPIFRFLANRLFSLASTIETYEIALGKKFGETVTPVEATAADAPGAKPSPPEAD